MKTQAQQLYTPGQGRQLFAEFVKAARWLAKAQNEPERFGCVGPSPAELAMNQMLTLAGNICTALDSPPENADAMLKAQRDELLKALMLCYEHCRIYHPEVETNNVGEAVRAAIANVEGADNSVDYWQQRGYLGSPDEWREACRLFRLRCSPDDIQRMAKLRAYIDDGLLIVSRPAKAEGKEGGAG